MASTRNSAASIGGFAVLCPERAASGGPDLQTTKRKQ